MLIDDTLVYRGSLLPSPTIPGSSSNGFDWGSADEPKLMQSILFTNDSRIVSREISRIPLVEDEIVFFDEGHEYSGLATANAAAEAITYRDDLKPKQPQQPRRPMTSVRGGELSTTSSANAASESSFRVNGTLGDGWGFSS